VTYQTVRTWFDRSLELMDTKYCWPVPTMEIAMPESSDGPDGAVGAEKSPRKVAWFIFGVFVALALALGIMLLVFRHHAPVPQTGEIHIRVQ
jgi:hypothetical protein